MSADSVQQEFLDLFPVFRREPVLAESFLSHGSRQVVPAGQHLYWEGDRCNGIAFLYGGGIRVYKCGETGREITLYDIGPGETCILNASCIMGEKAYPANAVTTAPTDLLLVPAQKFRQYVESHEVMRTFVFALLSQRLNEVMSLVEEVAFRRMDERLLDYLMEKSGDGMLSATHQKIANDLGSSREVISRLLKELERQGDVELGRNEIRVKAIERRA